jgi:hypothetical protein
MTADLSLGPWTELRQRRRRSRKSGNGKTIRNNSEAVMASEQTLRRWELQLQPRPEAAWQARAAVTPLVSDFEHGAAFRARLAVSELVANCVRQKPPLIARRRSDRSALSVRIVARRRLDRRPQMSSSSCPGRD